MTKRKIQYKKRRDRSNRGEKEEREGDTGNGIRQKEEKKRDQSLRLAQGRSCGRRRTRTHTKKIHACPATHTQRRKERQRRNVIHRHSFRRAVNPNWSRAVADERRKKERDKSDDCWDSRMVAADVACSGGRRDCRFSSPLAFFPHRRARTEGERECVARKRRGKRILAAAAARRRRSHY